MGFHVAFGDIENHAIADHRRCDFPGAAGLRSKARNPSNAAPFPQTAYSGPIPASPAALRREFARRAMSRTSGSSQAEIPNRRRQNSNRSRPAFSEKSYRWARASAPSGSTGCGACSCAPLGRSRWQVRSDACHCPIATAAAPTTARRRRRRRYRPSNAPPAHPGHMDALDGMPLSSVSSLET